MIRSLMWLWLLSTLAWAAPTWKDFRSSEGTFRGVFPAAPKASQSQTNTPLGQVATRVYSSSNSKGNYAIACTELPGAAVKFAADKVISDAKAAVLKDANATEINWSDVNGGHELSYRSAQGLGWCQIFLVGNRLYVLDARMRPGTSRTDWVLPFFARFSPLI